MLDCNLEGSVIIKTYDTQPLETVLNLLEKKDKEIEKYKLLLAKTHGQFLNNDIKSNQKNKEDLEALNEGWKIELEKKDRKLEERNNRIRNLEKECQKHFDNMMDIIQENSKKDKIIDEMANKIFEEGIIWKSKEDVKQYFEKKAEG